MSHLKRTVAALGVPALLALSLSACGSSASSAPKDASVTDFCSAFNGVASADNFKDGVKKLEDTGTPSDMSSDARKGFEVLVSKADSAGSISDLENTKQSDFSSDQQKQLQAFIEYYTTKCSPTGSAPSSAPS